jgi:hypothetical protein
MVFIPTGEQLAVNSSSYTNPGTKARLGARNDEKEGNTKEYGRDFMHCKHSRKVGGQYTGSGG